MQSLKTKLNLNDPATSKFAFNLVLPKTVELNGITNRVEEKKLLTPSTRDIRNFLRVEETSAKGGKQYIFGRNRQELTTSELNEGNQPKPSNKLTRAKSRRSTPVKHRMTTNNLSIFTQPNAQKVNNNPHITSEVRITEETIMEEDPAVNQVTPLSKQDKRRRSEEQTVDSISKRNKDEGVESDGAL